jgi:phosphatidylserine/phosphatidylglycerophosphate/cardiolipin synthase-like enzyme
MRRMFRPASFMFFASLLGCGSAQAPQKAPDIARVQISLVESEPIETTLDRPDIENAADVWLQMVNGAKSTIDVAQFYASEAEAAWLASSKLTPIIDALVHARERGVTVRFLVDEKFVPKYPDTIDRLAKAGIEVRRIKSDTLYGGVQHAKYFVVDGSAAFIGSQNFDWRALDHIQEMGVRLYSTKIGDQLLEIFETDWALAGGAPASTRIQRGTPSGVFPGIETGHVQLVASPQGWLPDPDGWELPRIVLLLDGAEKSIQIQVLKYKTLDRSGERFTTLDEALRRAAARGVKVQMIVSEWAVQDKNALDALQSLSSLADIRVLVIPKWSGGEIPFARVAHAKYLVVDGKATWIGSSNWEGDYFTKSRNVGIIAQDGKLPARMAAFFEENWSGNYAVPLAKAASATTGR